MLFRNISLISMILSVLGFAFPISRHIWKLPVIFILSFLTLTFLWLLVCFICTRFISLKKECREESKLYRYFSNRIIESVTQVLRVKVHTKGKEILPDEKFLFVGNHISLLDPMVTMWLLAEYNMGFVAKKIIFKIPFIRRLMHRCFCLCLDREDIKQSAKCISKAAETIRCGRASMGIYPEGQRNLESDELLPFMNGAFKIAKKAGCPIVVGVIKNARNVSKNFPFKKTDVYLEFIEVIDKDFVAENSTVRISEKAREIMEQHLENKVNLNV